MDKILGGQKVLYEPKGQNQWPQWKSWKIRCPLRVRNISQWAQGPQQRTDVSHWSPQCIIQLFNKHFLVPTDCQAPNYADAQQRKCISCLQGQETRKKQERQERQDKNTNNFSERLKVTNTPPPQASDMYFLVMSYAGGHSSLPVAGSTCLLILELGTEEGKCQWKLVMLVMPLKCSAGAGR